ncbi:MAG: hypothetical protein ABS888_02790 [Eubacteriales bacterium]|jgi:hypothetical protein
MKKFAAVLLVLILIVSISAPAFAVTYPTIRLRSATTQYVKRGRTASFKFYLKSGSYYRQSGYYRAKYDVNVYRSSNGRKYATGAVYFTGNLYHTMKWNVPSSTPKGRYNVIYRTLYRDSIYSDTWYYRNQYKCYLYVR